MKFDPCEYCKGTIRTRRVTVDLRRGVKLCVFENVPVGVCAKCGERYYPGRLLEHLEEIIEHGLQGARKVQVSRFDYRQVG